MEKRIPVRMLKSVADGWGGLLLSFEKEEKKEKFTKVRCPMLRFRRIRLV
jgi:hypothetical protein